MRNKVWLWFLAGWLLSLAFSPRTLMGVFQKKG